MKLFYHQNKNGIANFGDDLNPWLWPRLLSDVLDEDPATMFLGIGTLLNDRLPAAPARVVFGTGAGIGGSPVLTPSWTFYAVRGPLTARALGLSPSVAVTDSAILVSHIVSAAPATREVSFAFMPHYRSAGPQWRRVCDRLGFAYIDPRRPLEEVLAGVRATEVLLAEAMHGAIVADTLRVPWIPIRSREKILSFKWQDWCQSMEVAYDPVTTTSLWEGKGTGSRLKSIAKEAAACVQLWRAARRRPTLSRNEVFTSRRNRLDELLEQLRRDVRGGRFASERGRSSLSVPSAGASGTDAFLVRES